MPLSNTSFVMCQCSSLAVLRENYEEKPEQELESCWDTVRRSSLRTLSLKS